MQMLFDLSLQVLNLFDALYIFFFLPLKDVPGALMGLISPEDVLLSDLLTFLFSSISRVAPWMFNVSLATILVGSGLTILLLWRVAKLFLPIS